MPVSAEQIDLWKSLPKETPHLEFKTARNQFDTDELYDYCVAIGNEGGGHLILGVSDRTPRAVVGSQAFLNTEKTAEKIFQVLGFRVDVDSVAHPDGRVVAFTVPSRPRGTAFQHKGKYLMRVGESLLPMSEDQLRKIFAEGEPDWIEEPSISGLRASEIGTLLDCPALFSLMTQPMPTNAELVMDRLVEMRLIDWAASGYSIRRIAALLFANRLSDFPELERKGTRVVVYKEKSKLDTITSFEGQRGYALDFSLLVRQVAERLPQNEVIENAIRKDVRLVPDVVVRELLANALIHQDLRLTGTSPMVEIYSDRVEISNPGEPIVPVGRFIDGYQSRNERIATLMRRMGICEEKGSGIDRVIAAVENYQLPAPDIRMEHRRTSVVIFGHKKFADLDRDDRIRACYQHCVLKYVMASPMTNQTLRERFDLGEGKTSVVSQTIQGAALCAVPSGLGLAGLFN